jgi:hypothetical protein
MKVISVVIYLHFIDFDRKDFYNYDSYIICQVS